VLAVEAFVEKPDAVTAANYVTDRYLWNSGNVLFHAATMLSEIERFEPAMAEAAKAAVHGLTRDLQDVDSAPRYQVKRNISIARSIGSSSRGQPRSRSATKSATSHENESVYIPIGTVHRSPIPGRPAIVSSRCDRISRCPTDIAHLPRRRSGCNGAGAPCRAHE
jgi:Nucleotidyl transferase